MTTYLMSLIGFLLPLRWTSRLYLVSQLKTNGVETRLMSKACLQELADFSVHQTDNVTPRANEYWKVYVTMGIEEHAVLIKDAIGNTGGDESYNLLRSILKKHGTQLKDLDAIME